MNGLDLLRSPKTTAEEIADVVSAQCPPVVPENCDAFSCRECWLAWLTTGEPPKEKGPSDKQTAPGEEGMHPNLVRYLKQHKHLVRVLEAVEEDINAGSPVHTSR